jgi:YVTN family beta-propeller protein
MKPAGKSVVSVIALALGAIAVAFAIRGHVKTTPLPSRGSEAAAANIYAATGKNALAPAAARARPLVYVPNSRSATVTVIDPATYRVIRSFSTGALPQHVVPSYDLSTLWVANNEGNSLTPIDPVTGEEGTRVPVDDPYNLYFTPDGRFALVVAERLNRIDFRDAHDMSLVQSLSLACKGVDHMEFTADGRSAIATCEFSGQLVKIDLVARAVIGYLNLEAGASSPMKNVTSLFRRRHRRRHATGPMPQDIRSSPDGKVFYVADMRDGGVVLVDPIAFTRVGFVTTGTGAHGLYPSRDGTRLYVTNRGWSTITGGRRGPGSISVLDFSTGRIVENWPVPGGGSPDMGNVTADGSELWVSGRYDNEVYVFDTATGTLTHRIPVGREPHGLCVWPQPGRYSLGHTGNMR